MAVYAIIVAAGSGSRAGGDVPKQFQLLAGKPVYQWSLDTFVSHHAIETSVLVVSAEMFDAVSNAQDPETLEIVLGGESRTESVLAGLTALDAADSDIVLIHDAARPGLTSDVIDDLIGELATADAAAPALPIVDALKRVDQGRVTSVSREKLYRVQTPQAFHVSSISSALMQDSQEFVDDLAAIEGNGGKVVLLEGNEGLAKITFPGDLERMEQQLLNDHLLPRVGTGFDVHAFGPGTEITLCGLSIPHSHGLVGHSDADVAWHTLTDAILGALALGDIGDHFPPSDIKWKGAASSIFLKHAAKLADDAGYQIGNCDITIICEQPKIGPHRDAMREETAKLLNLPISAVSVKATTSERLGFTGRGEGIAAQAACMLVPKTTVT
ncbi:MAG: bifunctional 2-C-methyl-D-erythritol 4-phosphate cytidylyltransferase/2-C-methyl-D-erythritol 2,4-cyclodiphosphate synthase [Pseudomonadota bacterium]